MIRTKEDPMANLEYIRADLRDWTACDDPLYKLCDAYGVGYSAGKASCHSELRAWSPHTPRCGCEPCKTVAAVVKAALVDTPSFRIDAHAGGWVSVRLEVGDAG